MPFSVRETESNDDNRVAPTYQMCTIICYDCQEKCQAVGRMGDSIYTWCRCGRYIQIYNQVSQGLPGAA